MKHDQDRIAVIGISCWYPGAKSPLELWENILSKRQQFRKMPDIRLPLEKYHSSDRKSPDKTYGTKAALIDGFDFDWKSHRIPQKTFIGTDIVHWLALDVALKALEDAGYDSEKIKNYQTGVVLGNTLTGEWTRTNSMRTRWPFFRDTMISAAKAHGITGDAFENYLQTTEQTFKSVFPDVTEDTLAGGLSNTIAGRICNYLDLHGGGYTIDGACSSSLLAVINAANSLKQGSLDMAFVGGIDISLDTFELIGFAKTGALTDSEMRVYDRRASGFIPGEGCGFIVLKRYKDAVKDNDRIYAVLNGWGISSDGKGGLTAPSVSGQSLAMQKAYEMAGYSINSLDFIEGHGTGTPVGDQVEVGAILDALDPEKQSSIGITSLKTIIGHTKAAAGIGALIKAVMAVNRRILPPLAGCEIPHDIFAKNNQRVYPLMEGVKKSEERPLKAGVSAMGFGGINSHVTLSSGEILDESLEPELPEEKIMSSYDNYEVFPFSAHSKSDLINKIKKVINMAETISASEVLDLACECSRKVRRKDAYKASVVAQKPDDLCNKLIKLLYACEDFDEKNKILTNNDISISYQAKQGSVAFVYPGQGSQHLNMGKKLVKRHDWAEDYIKEADEILEKNDLSIQQTYFYENSHSLTPSQKKTIIDRSKQTELAQPAICAVSALWSKRLNELGIMPDTVMGHSLGELTALWATGRLSYKELIEVASKRGKLMAHDGDNQGSMASLSTSEEKAQEIISQIDDYLVIANLNSEDQTIVSGSKKGIEKLVALGETLDIRIQELNVSNAFHSNYMNDASKEFADYLKKFNFSSSHVNFFSSYLAKEVKDINASEYLSKQLLGQVNYLESIQKLAETNNIIIEVGPGNVLTSLNKKNLDHSVLCLCVNDKNSDYDFKNLISKWYVSGGRIQWDMLYKDRFVKAFENTHEKQFIENPCERDFGQVEVSAGDTIEIPQSKVAGTPQIEIVENKVSVSQEGDALSIVLDAIYDLTGFEKESIDLEMRVLDDLNMDSIKASELVSSIALKMDMAGDVDFGNFANATIQDLVDVVESVSKDSPQDMRQEDTANLKKYSNSTFKRSNKTPWVRTFQEVLVKDQLDENVELNHIDANAILVLYPDAVKDDFNGLDMPFKGLSIREYGNQWNESDHFSDYIVFVDDLYHLSIENIDQYISELHQFIKKITSKGNTGIHFIQRSQQMIQLDSFLASLSQEVSNIRLSYLNFYSELDLEFVFKHTIEEIQKNKSFQSIWFGDQKDRFIRELKIVDESEYEDYDPGLGSEDIILVTGGAKGITAACALSLAKKTGSKFALVGSSELNDKSKEIWDTLNEFQALGIEAKYYACDILDSNSVKQMIALVNSEMGCISAFIHGAGLNKPALLKASETTQAQKEFKVKVMGAQSILENLNLDKLKVFAGFTSVIGVLGMPGNAWYALANKTLDQFSRKVKDKYPKMHAVCLAYSVWDELGMGAKLGSIDRLESMGISPISPEEGIKRFLKGIFSTLPSQQHVITSRMGMTDIHETTDLDFRYIERVVSHQKNIETISQVYLDPEIDTYLLDHNYKGTYLFPTVFGLEAMAQVVCHTLGLDRLESVSIENITLDKPITVSQTGDHVEIYAEVLEKNNEQDHLVVKTGIRCAKTGYKVDHFSANFVLKEFEEEKYLGFDTSLSPLGIDPKIDLYGPILFQGEKFQRIKEIYHLESDDENKGMTILRSEYRNDNGFITVLGDPYYRDSLLQSAQLIIPKNQCLPVRIAKLHVTGKADYTGSPNRMAISNVVRVDEKSFTATIKVIDSNGIVLEVLEDYILQFIERVETNPRAAELIHDEKKSLMNFESYSNRHPKLIKNPIYVGPISNTNYLQQTLGQKLRLDSQAIADLNSVVIKEGEQSVRIADRNVYLFTSKSSNHYLTQASLDKTMPCHLSIYNPKDSKLSDQLNGLNIENIDAIGTNDPSLMKRIEGLNYIFTALGLETKGTNIKFNRLDDHIINFYWKNTDGEYIEISSIHIKESEHRIYTLVNQYHRNSNMQVEMEDHTTDPLLKPYKQISKVLRIDADPNGPQGQSVFVNSFIPDFKAFANLGRSIYFSHFFNWMGSARELSSVPVLDRIRELTESGKWGLVTNWASIDVLGQCRNRDRIVQVRMWCGKISGAEESTVTLNFDWISIGDGGIEERIATGKMGFTWVEIIGHGIVKPAKFPEYYREFIDSMVAKNDDKESYIPAPEPLKHLTPGVCLFKSQKGPRGKIFLKEKEFETSLFDANLVGNLYFGNYSIWMGKIRDHYLQNMIPEYYTGVGEYGEFRCKDCTIQHLREAMPFDKIKVVMSLNQLYECGLGLYFEYYKVNENGKDEKLAFGEHKAIWCVSDENGNVKQVPLPKKIMKILSNMIVDRTVVSVG